MKKLIIKLLWLLKAYIYILLIYLIIPISVVSYWLWLTPKSIKQVEYGNIIYNLRKSRTNCKSGCYAIWECERYYGSCSSNNSGVLLHSLDKVYDIYNKNDVFYILVPKDHYSIKDKWNTYDEYRDSSKLITTENIDGNMVEKYKKVVNGKEYNISVIYR